MMLKAVLFDLDGTLLPMDQDVFTREYFNLLAKKLTPHGYEKEQLVSAIWHGTKAMVLNDGSRTNEEVFWEDFENIYGEKGRNDKTLVNEFYASDFDLAKSFCGYDEMACKVIRILKDSGCRVALATNPIFPAIATEKRIRWAGLTPEDFELYTTYENIGYCKPNPEYYKEILRRMSISPEECMMVGNDTDEDMIAESLGMKVFLITDHVVNRKGFDINSWPHGGFEEFIDEWKRLGSYS